VECEIARSAQRVYLTHSAGEDRLAAVDDVAEAIVASPHDAAIDGVLAVDHVIDLDGLIVLALAGERGEVEARGIEPIASSEVVGQGYVLYDALNLWVESETLRVARADIVSSDADAGQHVAVRIDRCAGDTRRKIAPALHVAEDALAGLGRVDSARGH